MQTNQFIIYSLPRSRTKWLSKFLSYKDVHCGHDESRYFRSLEDIKSWLSLPMTGTVETSAAPWWRLVQKLSPHIKSVVIRRSINEVMDSLARSGIHDTKGLVLNGLTKLNKKLDQIENRIPGVISINFSDLSDEVICKKLFEHCLPYSYDHDWWMSLKDKNIQINMNELLNYCIAYKPQMDRLISQLKQFSLSDIYSKRVITSDGLIIGQESFESFYRDSVDLFKEHMAEVGELPEAYSKKNIPLLRAIDKMGAMQVTTARCNGKIFGYLMAIISPSLEAENSLCGLHTTFFTSSSFPGLGLKLQRASIQKLKERGVNEVLFRSGVRGSGPRLSSLYKRLGAEELGQLYRLDMRSM